MPPKRETAEVEQEEEENEVEEAKEADEGKKVEEPTKGTRQKAVAQEARTAASELNRKRKAVHKLQEERDALAQRVKVNRDSLRRAEQEVEELRAVAKKKAQVASKVKNAQMGERLAMKAETTLAQRSKTNASMRKAKSRVEETQFKLSASQSKANEIKRTMSSAKAKFDEADKTCKALKAKGEEVPGEGDKDMSAPGAWKPPGFAAAKTRALANVALTKAQAVLAKAVAEVEDRERKHQDAQSKLDEVKKRRKIFDDRKNDLESKLAEVMPRANGKAKGKAKAKAKSKGHVINIHKKPASK